MQDIPRYFYVYLTVEISLSMRILLILFSVFKNSHILGHAFIECIKLLFMAVFYSVLKDILYIDALMVAVADFAIWFAENNDPGVNNLVMSTREATAHCLVKLFKYFVAFILCIHMQLRWQILTYRYPR